ncbi:MAG: hypothetical protein A3G24_01675 [Betaproteobacteria bacterium RIFCSPLOWO2_12_FULL_62_13]|nr:MAG: hypothetical protein A3G24_01675 [Betaproteobacteria bacterium RIFCSPLOWO2_12_FULL_62_13]
MWFLGYDLDTEIPDRSVLFAGEEALGVTLFREFFERIVLQDSIRSSFAPWAGGRRCGIEPFPHQVS